jgi:hypothetical protein
VVRDDWLQVGLSTQPADRARAEEGVRLAYQSTGLAPPAVVVWLGSPLAGWIAAALLDGGVWEPVGPLAGKEAARRVHEQVMAQLAEHALGEVGGDAAERVWGQPCHQLRFQARVQVAGRVWRRLVAQIQDQIAARVWDQVAARVWDEVVVRHANQPGAQIWGRQISAPVFGAHHAQLLGFYDYLARAAAELAGPERLRGHMLVARSAGWWWPFERAVIVTERPRALHRDEQGRMHHADGPAITWADGFGVWAWHGVRVHRGVIEQPQRLTYQNIHKERDVEVRRVLLERYGHARFLRDAGARRVHADDTGILWRCPLPDDEPLVMVEVANATPEPDGTRRAYWLRVPPGMRTARQAVAWTFGLGEGDYHPTAQT